MVLYQKLVKDSCWKNPMALQLFSLPTTHALWELSAGTKKGCRANVRLLTTSQQLIPSNIRRYGVLFLECSTMQIMQVEPQTLSRQEKMGTR